ncbi:MAG: hypothetical protein ABSF60_15080 [Verrucomicrobiota bacterium]|jgi:hypothetical protein
MKTLITIFWAAVFGLLTTGQGICQQVMEPKPPAEATVTGVIKSITRGSFLDLTVAEENRPTQDMRINLPQEIKITMDGGAATAGDLRIGKAITVAYTTSNPVPSATNAPAEDKIVRTAKSISIIFGTNSPSADNTSLPPQTSARIPDDFVGSWSFVQEEKHERMLITTNHIRWYRNVSDPQEVYDSNSYKLNDKGDISFDTKVFLSNDASAPAAVILKARNGKLLMKVGPAFIDLGAAKLSNPGEELVYVRDRTSTPPGNKPSPTQ